MNNYDHVNIYRNACVYWWGLRLELLSSLSGSISVAPHFLLC